MSGEDAALELGSGIADSLTNALKSVASLSVIDLDVVAEAAKQSPDLDVVKRDADAVALGEKLSLQMIVVGSYQRIGSQIRIDARVLNVSTNRPLSGEPIVVTDRYPDGYFGLLTQLSEKIVKSLQVKTTPAETRQIDSLLKDTKLSDARSAYNRGIAKMAVGNAAALEQAIQLFSEAVSKDPDFGLAYAAKSEAETRLIEANRATGQQALSLPDEALRDAETSVAKSPRLSRGYKALANARTGLGQYDQATAAARKAIELTPSDAGAFLALSRANGRGALVRDSALDRAFELQPGISFVMRECPKVTVVNNTSGWLVVTFSPAVGTGKEYPPMRLKAATSHRMAILPGSFLVGSSCETTDVFEEYSFDAGQEYKLTYTGAGCRDRTTPAFIVHNNGSAAVAVQISGVTNRLISHQTVPGHQQKRIVVVPGQYSVLVTAPGVQPSTANYSLGPRDEEELEFSIVQEFGP